MSAVSGVADSTQDFESAEPALICEAVGLRFPDGTEALTDVSFQARHGEFVSIVGPSGCGKSTLLRVVAGLARSSTGVCAGPKSGIGFVFQDSSLMPWRTVLGNVEILARLAGVRSEERHRSALAALRLVGLEEVADKYPRQLSGGMRMRASLARALVAEPTLLLLDEPFGALDEITRERLNGELLELHLRKKFTCLFVTHSISEAVYLSNRVLVMSSRPGRIVESVPVPFGFPRSHDLRYEPEFGTTCSRVSRALRSAE